MNLVLNCKLFRPCDDSFLWLTQPTTFGY